MESIKLQKIDESLLSEHSCLDDSDRCYFIGEYESGLGFNHSPMNQLINNFKKPMDRKNKSEWYFKERAVGKIADQLVSLTSWDKLKIATWVPIPSSKIKSDPGHDDRLWRALLNDIRELLLAKFIREAAHNPGATRLKVNDHLKNFTIDAPQKEPKPYAIILFDDIVTSGAHAISSILSAC